jgi:hypothetical protein
MSPRAIVLLRIAKCGLRISVIDGWSANGGLVVAEAPVWPMLAHQASRFHWSNPQSEFRNPQ